MSDLLWQSENEQLSACLYDDGSADFVDRLTGQQWHMGKVAIQEDNPVEIGHVWLRTERSVCEEFPGRFRAEAAGSRTVRYRFTRGGYVGLAKAYRLYAQSIGLFRSLREKIADLPAVANLIGGRGLNLLVIHLDLIGSASCLTLTYHLTNSKPTSLTAQRSLISMLSGKPHWMMCASIL